MKTNFRMNLGIMLIMLLVSSITASANPASKAHKNKKRLGCITCGYYANCRSCVPGGNSDHCQTPDCSTCIEGGSCGGFSDPPPEGGGSRPDSNLTNNVFRLDSKTIKEIAGKHPRFAATLANLNIFGFVPGTQKIHWTPIEINSDEVEAFLNRESYKDFFLKYNERARQINELIIKGEIDEILYIVTISQQEHYGNTVKLEVERGLLNYAHDPAYSVLEISVPFNNINPENVTVNAKVKPTWSIR